MEEKSEAFCEALKNSNFKCAEFLWDIGIDVNFKDYHHGDTPLMRAAYADQYSLMKKLTAAGANVNDVSAVGSGALHCSRSKECIELLIREGAHVNLKDKYGRTPLHYAVQHGSINCSVSLLLAGADVNAKSNTKETPLIKAARRGKVREIEFLLENLRESEERMKILLQAGADVNARNSSKATALLVAAVGNRLDFVKLLLQAGAQVRIIYEVGCSTLQIYVITHLSPWRPKCDTEMIRLLHAAGERKERVSERTIYQLQSNRTWIRTYLPDALKPEECTKIAWEYLSDDDQSLCLKDICRRAIREHLLQMSRVNLFVRVPHLGLPSLITDFLLYNVSLELP